MGSENVFAGMAEAYDKARFALPEKVADVAERYLDREIGCVVDVGCGTGLSISAWLNHAQKIIGVEPAGEMRRFAERKFADTKKVQILPCAAEQMDIKDQSVDVVSCVQVFHWLDREKALLEFDRVLRPGGIFLACDFDFPPVTFWRADRAYQELLNEQKRLGEKYPVLNKNVNEGDKNQNLKIIQNSGLFSYCREIVLDGEMMFDAQHYIDLAYSQSPLQRILNAGIPEGGVITKTFKKDVEEAFCGRTCDTNFCMRIRLGIKK